MKKAIRMACFNRFCAAENHSILCALKMQIPSMSAGYWWIAVFRNVQYNASICSDKSVSKDLNCISLLGKYLHTDEVLRVVFGKEGHKLFLRNYKLCRQDRNCWFQCQDNKFKIVQYLRFWHWCFWRVKLSYPGAQHNIPDGLKLKQNTI